ncbi:MAG: hypothetical protein IK077_05330 [Thermoguttaceae bacterium]|nr:hypothetical protein [Thermoguttaceae bacterium]
MTLNVIVGAVTVFLFLIIFADGYRKGEQIEQLEERTRYLERTVSELWCDIRRLKIELNCHGSRYDDLGGVAE